ncbi:MAG: FGGY-family carbohydrate kinase, partial [Spirochaetaceae bacterium]|nr:FGGY-family carbohydrate kinase [Spirochaetaceae bacterium]
MSSPVFVITYDVGTTGVKTCIYEISDKITQIESSYAGYNLYIFDNGGAEQDPDEWWEAICKTTKQALNKTSLNKDDIKAVSFCSQMQCLVLSDNKARPVRRAMSYMDNRARQLFGRGPSIIKLLTWIRLTGIAPTSTKDPLWKYKWVERYEGEVFSRVYKWLDAKDYLAARLTGVFAMTEGSAHATALFDTHLRGWSKKLCKIAGVKREHLPEIIKSYDKVGGITPRAAEEIGLAAGTPVYGGGGDAELVGIGAGAVEQGSTHIYIGTSGWVSTVTKKQVVDISASIGSIVGCQPGLYNYFAEMETAGKSLEWVKDHLALDEIDIYLEKKDVTEDPESVYLSLFDYLCEVIRKVPAGSNGVVFTPWLHGNRCPFEDSGARGIFFNIGLETGKTALIRSVVEGIAFHCRYMLEAQKRKIETSEIIIACGGGALSPVVCQILADIIGHKVITRPEPQNVGALGAAVLIAKAIGKISSIEGAKDLLPEHRLFVPNPEHKAVYDRNFSVFKSLYKNNKKSFALLNTVNEK